MKLYQKTIITVLLLLIASLSTLCLVQYKWIINTDEEIHDIWIQAGWESNSGSDIRKIIDDHNQEATSRLALIFLITSIVFSFTTFLFQRWSE